MRTVLDISDQCQDIVFKDTKTASISNISDLYQILHNFAAKSISLKNQPALKMHMISSPDILHVSTVGRVTFVLKLFTV
jgi:hypothetical protein